jgi:hypothetical protein
MFCKLAVSFAILAASLLLPGAVRADEDVTLARLVMRDCTVIISQGKDGARYLIKDRDGELLHSNLSENELIDKILSSSLKLISCSICNNRQGMN